MWLRRLLGMKSPGTPPIVQDAIDTAEAARSATTEARSAVGAYWRARRAESQAAQAAMTSDYAEAERRRLAR